MADFLEEVLYSTVKYGSSWQDEYNVNVVETSGGQEYRSLTHPFPKRTFTLDFELATADMWPNILDLQVLELALERKQEPLADTPTDPSLASVGDNAAAGTVITH